jgi:hypothetical protein
VAGLFQHAGHPQGQVGAHAVAVDQQRGAVQFGDHLVVEVLGRQVKIFQEPLLDAPAPARQFQRDRLQVLQPGRDGIERVNISSRKVKEEQLGFLHA